MATRKALYVDLNGDSIESTGMYETADYIDVSTGVADAGKPIVLNSDGVVDPTMVRRCFDTIFSSDITIPATKVLILKDPIINGSDIIIDGELYLL
jgi:hypothetical protein